jgi:type II restriction enzyme
LIQYIITDEVEALGLKVINGNTLERSEELPKDLSQVKRNLAINYGIYGMHLPDVDIIIYEPKNYKVLAVISSKVTLRERIAQTGYWKLKLLQDENTRHIKVYFVTSDEDGTLTRKKPAKKGRAIVEVDLDGSYVLTEENIEESDKVKLFPHFIDDLKRLLKNED